jgi:diaminohydroxyphosphoribosylaminopyrimidine deaminase/5-amino-6-(5-phosphoribosylamino)uracil reductase
MEDRSPVPIVVDGGRRVPEGAKLFKAARERKTILATRAPDTAGKGSHAALSDAGVEILDLPEDTPGHVDLAAMLRALGDKGLTRVMVEGGGGMGAALLRLGLVDRIAWFRAPILLGGEGVPAIAGLELAKLADAPAFERTGLETLGDDLLETYRRRA